MADRRGGSELGKRNKGKATWELEDGPSGFPSFTSACGPVGFLPDGVEDEEEEEEESRDPLMIFGSGIMMMILSKLDARSVALARLVSREWLAVASSDKIWAPKEKGLVAVVHRDGSIMMSPMCEELWQGKAHIPRIAKVQGLPKYVAYSRSIKDGKRTRITRHDLCDHIWEFHFNEAASEYWRNLDPYWTGSGPPLRRYFHPDGSITADPDDPVWGGHESCYTIVTGLFGDGKIREHYMRINRWPTLSLQRRPDWGWVLANHLYCYTSIPDAADKPDGTGPYFPLD
ncbi:uncharacterized protein LOC127250517 [Andrographis paniculata]|uniref:uncharacterized protein LOC127250517 n=1 Tax=Andrographis paniculata TaxID=175694 RepID=UPI0021E920DF|nr:uncharacterized protein LOC127250517 [Andrographis paniculata]